MRGGQFARFQHTYSAHYSNPKMYSASLRGCFRCAPPVSLHHANLPTSPQKTILLGFSCPRLSRWLCRRRGSWRSWLRLGLALWSLCHFGYRPPCRCYPWCCGCRCWLRLAAHRCFFGFGSSSSWSRVPSRSRLPRWFACCCFRMGQPPIGSGLSVPGGGLASLSRRCSAVCLARVYSSILPSLPLLWGGFIFDKLKRPQSLQR